MKTNAIFPQLPGLGWGVVKTPQWSTRIIESVGGKEQRAGFYTSPRWRFSMSFDVLRNRNSIRELETLAGFFNARRGSLDSFLFEDPTDNSVTDQAIGNTVAGTTAYKLTRNFGGFIEPIAAVKGTPTIKINGATKKAGTDYTISSDGVLVLASSPVAGQAITWTGQFYFRVRFASDSVDFENFIGHLWKTKKLELVSVK